MEQKMETEKKKAEKQVKKGGKAWAVMFIIGLMALLGGVGCILAVVLAPAEVLPDLVFPKIPATTETKQIYSSLTGLPVADATAVTAPTYCVQTPNGLDGARPQVGLHDAGVVFEAIAERGITRFAAIYQAPKSAVIGPLRSLRLYYLQWDTPFDCTIVHAGGSDDAIEAVRYGGYRDLTENYAYMYRGNYPYYDRAWNNLFTNGALLKQFAADYGYERSDVNGFTRMTPAESERARVDALVSEKLVITQAATANTSTMAPKVTAAQMVFSGYDAYNVGYNYNAEANTYARSYLSGDVHDVYRCPGEELGEVIPEDVCSLEQMAPAVVVAMKIEESLAEDGYHEDIAVIGSGEVYIFQNGTVATGTWVKNSVDEQIRFYDATGTEIRLAPGQTFVEAVPSYGGIDFQ